jgi:DNA-binding NtrC family response regulator
VQDVLPEHQRSLLLFLDGRGFAPLGSHRRVFPEARSLAGTQRPLRELLEEGKLRPDVLYRMREETITLPPLRERPKDVAPIAE